MMGWLSLALTILTGYWLVASWLPQSQWRPRWLRVGWEAALGAAVGLGLASCVFFLLVWTGLGRPVPLLSVQLILAAGAALAWRIRKRRAPQAFETSPSGPSAGLWLLRAATAVALLLLVAGWLVTTQASPHGEWDAFSIWNLRAKYLAAGRDTWRNAVSLSVGGDLLGAQHPDYPLLLSSLTAQVWMLNGEDSPWVPAGIGLLYSLLAAALLAGALAWLREETAGCLACLLLVSGELFVSQSASQYADIPLACYALAATALLAGAEQGAQPRSLRVWAGSLAAMAAWTKNEGLVFLLLALLWTLWRGGVRGAAEFGLGALPVAALVAAFKGLLAPVSVGLFPTTAAEWVAQLTDPGRWRLVAEYYLKSLWELGVWWAHPAPVALVWLWARGCARGKRLCEAWVALISLGMLAADFAVYLVTTAELRWHLSTSANRLWLQMWPSLLLALFLASREAPAPGLSVEVARPSQKRKAGTSRRRL